MTAGGLFPIRSPLVRRPLAAARAPWAGGTLVTTVTPPTRCGLPQARRETGTTALPPSQASEARHQREQAQWAIWVNMVESSCTLPGFTEANQA